MLTVLLNSMFGSGSHVLQANCGGFVLGVANESPSLLNGKHHEFSSNTRHLSESAYAEQGICNPCPATCTTGYLPYCQVTSGRECGFCLNSSQTARLLQDFVKDKIGRSSPGGNSRFHNVGLLSSTPVHGSLAPAPSYTMQLDAVGPQTAPSKTGPAESEPSPAPHIPDQANPALSVQSRDSSSHLKTHEDVAHMYSHGPVDGSIVRSAQLSPEQAVAPSRQWLQLPGQAGILNCFHHKDSWFVYFSLARLSVISLGFIYSIPLEDDLRQKDQIVHKDDELKCLEVAGDLRYTFSRIHVH